jgi:hypothetical protein
VFFDGLQRKGLCDCKTDLHVRGINVLAGCGSLALRHIGSECARRRRPCYVRLQLLHAERMALGSTARLEYLCVHIDFSYKCVCIVQGYVIHVQFIFDQVPGNTSKTFTAINLKNRSTGRDLKTLAPNSHCQNLVP